MLTLVSGTSKRKYPPRARESVISLVFVGLFFLKDYVKGRDEAWEDPITFWCGFLIFF